MLWSAAIVATSKPIFAIAGAARGSIEKTVPLSCWTKLGVMAHSKSLTATSAFRMRSRTAPALPERTASTTVQPKAGSQCVPV